MAASKKVTLRLHRMDLVEQIRTAMEKIEIPGYLRNPSAKIGTSAVVDFALSIMANLYLNPANLTINRHTFLKKLETLVNAHVPLLEKMSKEERRDYLEMMVLKKRSSRLFLTMHVFDSVRLLAGAIISPHSPYRTLILLA